MHRTNRTYQIYNNPTGEIEVKWCWFEVDKGKGRQWKTS